MKFKILILTAIAGLAIFATRPAFATAILTDGTVYGMGCSILNTDCAGQSTHGSANPGAPGWTFSGAANVSLADCCVSGDSFTLFDNGSSIGSTPTSTQSGTECDSPATVFSNSVCGIGTFSLGTGSHSLTIQSNLAGGGLPAGGYFKADSSSSRQTPEPASMLLLGFGLVGVRAYRKR